VYLHTDDSGETTPPMYDGVARLQARALTAQGRLTDELARRCARDKVLTETKTPFLLSLPLSLSLSLSPLTLLEAPLLLQHPR
jgi:hypothetical protein